MQFVFQHGRRFNYMSADCENCAQLAEQNDALQRRAVDEHEKREALTDELVMQRRQIGKLKGELTKLERADAPPQLVRFCFERWAEGQPGSPKLGPARTDMIARALNAKWGGRERVLRAIRGVRSYPFVVNGRRCGQGPRSARHDRLGLVLGDEEAIEKFGRLAFQADLANGVIRPGQVPKVVEVLTAEFGDGRVFGSYDDGLWWVDYPEERCWFAPCPKCGGWLRVCWLEGGGEQVECFAGCENIEAAVAELSQPAQRSLEAVA